MDFAELKQRLDLYEKLMRLGDVPFGVPRVKPGLQHPVHGLG
jgi:hypothetical protein